MNEQSPWFIKFVQLVDVHCIEEIRDTLDGTNNSMKARAELLLHVADVVPLRELLEERVAAFDRGYAAGIDFAVDAIKAVSK